MARSKKVIESKRNSAIYSRFEFLFNIYLNFSYSVLLSLVVLHTINKSSINLHKSIVFALKFSSNIIYLTIVNISIAYRYTNELSFAVASFCLKNKSANLNKLHFRISSIASHISFLVI